MDYKELTYLGLSEKEAKVYLSSLELGKSSAQKIAEKSKVNRATTYVQIESLTKKGLMSSYVEGKKQFFCAEAPEKLNLLFREQVMTIQRKQEYLDKIIPELKSIKGLEKGGKPVVRYFEGKDGLRAMSEEFIMLEHKDYARMIYSVDLLSQIFTDDEKKWMQTRRQKKKIKVKSIINDEKNKLVSDAICLRLSTKDYPIKSDIAFFGDKTRIATQNEPLLGMIIENKDITDTLKILFDLAWEYLNYKNKINKGSEK